MKETKPKMKNMTAAQRQRLQTLKGVAHELAKERTIDVIGKPVPPPAKETTLLLIESELQRAADSLQSLAKKREELQTQLAETGQAIVYWSGRADSLRGLIDRDQHGSTTAPPSAGASSAPAPEAN